MLVFFMFTFMFMFMFRFRFRFRFRFMLAFMFYAFTISTLTFFASVTLTILTVFISCMTVIFAFLSDVFATSFDHLLTIVQDPFVYVFLALLALDRAYRCSPHCLIRLACFVHALISAFFMRPVFAFCLRIAFALPRLLL
jgi:hypothetical protein